MTHSVKKGIPPSLPKKSPVLRWAKPMQQLDRQQGERDNLGGQSQAHETFFFHFHHLTFIPTT